MNSNFPKDDDLIRRAARNVRQNNEEPEPSFKDRISRTCLYAINDIRVSDLYFAKSMVYTVLE